MSFPKDVKERAAVACNRSCCICHQFKGLKLEFHHIKQEADGGENTFDNCIPLCFDCHGDMGGVNPRHPKGNSYSEKELRMHRDKWYEQCATKESIFVEATDEDIDVLFAPSESVDPTGHQVDCVQNTVSVDGLFTFAEELVRVLPVLTKNGKPLFDDERNAQGE